MHQGRFPLGRLEREGHALELAGAEEQTREVTVNVAGRTVNVRHPKEFTLFSKEDIFVSLSKVCLKNYTFSEFLDSSVSG